MHASGKAAWLMDVVMAQFTLFFINFSIFCLSWGAGAWGNRGASRVGKEANCGLPRGAGADAEPPVHPEGLPCWLLPCQTGQSSSTNVNSMSCSLLLASGLKHALFAIIT